MMAQKELDTGCSEDPDLLSTRQSVEQKREIAKRTKLKTLKTQNATNMQKCRHAKMQNANTQQRNDTEKRKRKTQDSKTRMLDNLCFEVLAGLGCRVYGG